MVTPQLIPMVAPDGTVGEIPSERVTEALAGKFRLGVKMQAPSGEIGIIPRDKLVQAVQTPGMHVLQDSAMYATRTDDPRAPAPGQPGSKEDPYGLKDIGDTASNFVKGAIKNAYQISTPGIAASLATKNNQPLAAKLPSAFQPTPANDLQDQIMMNALPIMVGVDALPRNSAVPLPKASGGVMDGVMSRATENLPSKAYQIAKEIPGVGRGIRILDIIRGKGEAPPPPAPPPTPTTPSPNVPTWLEFTKQNMSAEMKATGSHGEAMKSLSKKYADLKAAPPPAPAQWQPGPSAMWGKPAPIESAKTAPLPTRNAVDAIAKDAVRGAGGNPDSPKAPESGKPIYQRPKPAEAPKADAPKESSAVSGHEYDPESQTMTLHLKSGASYRYAEVTPEEAQAFASADSKGSAFQDIKNNHVLTEANYGKGWVRKSAPKALRSATPNTHLTPALEESIRRARAAKAK